MAFTAQHKGICLKCQGIIEIGQQITWPRMKGKKGVAHVNCSDVNAPAPIEEQDKVIPMEEHYTQEEETTMVTAKPTSAPAGSDVETAIQVLLGAINKKPEPAQAIDPEEVRRIVRECITAEGTLRIEVKAYDKPPVTVEGAHEMLPILLAFVARRKNVYLYGPHGSGKSTGAAQVAKALGLEYGYIALSPQTPESRLVGFIDANGNAVRTPFRDRFEHGGVMCIDENDNAAASLLTTLNSPLDNGHMAFPDAIVKKHKDFVLIGTGNTSGAGANPAYPERRPFDQAFGDRYLYLQWNYDEKLEKQIALSINKEADQWVRWVQSVRKWAKANHPRFTPSPRSTFRLAEFVEDKAVDRDILLDSVMWRGNDELKSKVLANCPLPA